MGGGGNRASGGSPGEPAQPRAVRDGLWAEPLLSSPQEERSRSRGAASREGPGPGVGPCPAASGPHSGAPAPSERRERACSRLPGHDLSPSSHQSQGTAPGREGAGRGRKGLRSVLQGATFQSPLGAPTPQRLLSYVRNLPAAAHHHTVRGLPRQRERGVRRIPACEFPSWSRACPAPGPGTGRPLPAKCSEDKRLVCGRGWAGPNPKSG